MRNLPTGLREGKINMALIKCPECNGDVSDKAATCPHCGYGFEVSNKGDNKEKQLIEGKKLILTVVSIMAIVIGILKIIGYM